MTFAELLFELDGQGISLPPNRIYSWLRNRKLPRPPMNRSLGFDYTQEHVQRIRELMATEGNGRQ